MSKIGMVIGYKRVSTVDQNEERQLAGQRLDKVFVDKCSSKVRDRPALRELLLFCREGDRVLVHSMDRLARSIDDLRKIIGHLTARQVSIQFLKEGISIGENADAFQNFIVNIMGSFSEFEREIIKERQREGIAIAKAKGKFKGRKPVLTEDIKKIIDFKLETNWNRSRIARELGISRSSLYKYMKERKK